MKLPFVSRELYDRAVREADAWRARHDAMQLRHWAEIDAHTAEPPKPEQVAPLADVVTKPEPSLVAQTIKEEADGDPKLARWLRKRASDLRREGKSDGDIVAELQKWETTEPEMGVLG